MADGVVWVSEAMMDTSLIKQFSADLFLENREKFRQAMEKKRAVQPIPPDLIPKAIFSETTRKVGSLPDFFDGGAYWIVSTELADILRQFDLGASALYPVKVYQHDRETPVPGLYECLSFGERKETFLPEKSERVRKRYNDDRDIWATPAAIRDDEIAVRQTALDGPDLWMEASRLPRLFFLSDPLVQAIKAAKLSRRMGLRRCRVIWDN